MAVLPSPGADYMARRICLICGGKLNKTGLEDNRWDYINKKSCYACEDCGRQWLYSPDLTCPVLLGEGDSS
jgi:hypothetical protein